MLTIKTSTYRYPGPDRLDITVKGQDPIGKAFAPTWDMVMGIKKNTMSQEEYVNRYAKILANIPPRILHDILSRESVTLVCFCKPGTFCHRYLAAMFLASIGGVYKGEI